MSPDRVQQMIGALRKPPPPPELAPALAAEQDDDAARAWLDASAAAAGQAWINGTRESAWQKLGGVR